MSFVLRGVVFALLGALLFPLILMLLILFGVAQIIGARERRNRSRAQFRGTAYAC